MSFDSCEPSHIRSVRGRPSSSRPSAPTQAAAAHLLRHMPSRQERRKAERAAARRAPTEATAAAAAAVAGTHLNVIPLGDWKTQTEDPKELFNRLGNHMVERMAIAGNRAAPYSRGFVMFTAADAPQAAASGEREVMQAVGLELCIETVSVRSTRTR